MRETIPAMRLKINNLTGRRFSTEKISAVLPASFFRFRKFFQATAFSESLSGQKIFLLIFILLLAASSISYPQEREFKDALGHKVRVPSSPSRIVSLAPNLTEILFSLGLNQEVIGVTRFCDYPEEARQKEVIGGLVDINLEKIYSLHPDLILGYRGNPKRVIEHLYREGLPAYVFDAGRTFEDLFQLIRTTGELTSRQKQADELISRLKKQIEAIEQTLPAGGKPMKVFLTLYGQGSGLWTCGGDSYLSFLLEKTRAHNIASSLRGNWLVYNREKLLQENPEIVLILCRPESSEKARSWFLSSPLLVKIQAARSGNIYTLDEDLFSRFSPRLVEAFRALAETIYNDGAQER
ncbi:MAG: ABC transporter substrate-binding protein [Candidatus Saccharicenans sp.]|nr:ABC transporter substrate-binding protein [Candidatus Saccharicenans sp.]